MKNSNQSWGLVALFVTGGIACLLCAGPRRASAQAPIEFGVSQDYGSIDLGSGQKTVVENTNNSQFQMVVETHFIANDGSDVIPAVSVSIPPKNTTEIFFTPPSLPAGCKPGGSVPCKSEAFRVRVVAAVTTDKVKPPLEDMCDTLLSTQSIVGAGGTAFLLAPMCTHAWPGTGQLLSPEYSQCKGAR
jgi:hypothetical protein